MTAKFISLVWHVKPVLADVAAESIPILKSLSSALPGSYH